MLKIKLARFGKKKQPHYRIVINEARDKRDGQYVDLVGHYAPTMTPKVLDFDMVKVEAWLKKGAQPTDTVNSLLTRYKSGNPFPPKKNHLSRKAKAKLATADADKAAAAEAAKAEKAAAEAPVAPTEAAASETTEAAQ